MRKGEKEKGRKGEREKGERSRGGRNGQFLRFRHFSPFFSDSFVHSSFPFVQCHSCWRVLSIS